jgi:hypothetical protein
MKSTDHVTTALRRVLSRNPEFRKKLAHELREARSKRGALDRDYMVWQSLHKLTERAPQILDLMRSEPEDVETWHERNVNLAAEYIDAVFDSLSCKSDDAVGCDEIVPPEAIVDEETIEDLETGDEDFMRMASPAPGIVPAMGATNTGAIKAKLLLVLLFDALGRLEMWPPGIDSALTRANLEANRAMAPMDRQRARLLAGKVASVLARLGLAGDVEAAMLSRTLLEAVQNKDSVVPWAAALEPVLVKLNLILYRMLSPEGRTRQLQMAMRLTGIVERLV